MSEVLLETHGLTKAYGKRNVVDDVNLHIHKGSIYGLVGRNGAGKTTLMKIITGMTKPTDGTFEYNGLGADLKEAYGKIGVLVEIPAIMPSMTAYDNMKFKCIGYNCVDDAFIRETLQLVGLSNTGSKKASKFSLGMKQRLGIALALVGNPEILILDEPINGLDPQGIVEIRELLIKLNQERGTTIIISSHILTELSKLATEYAFIENGRIVEELTREELENNSRSKLIIKCEDARAADKVLKENGFSNYEVADNETIFVYDKEDVGPVMNMKICQAGIMVRSFAYEVADLEEYFLNIINGVSNKGNDSAVSAAADKEVV